MTRIELSNGLRVIVRTNRLSPSVAIRLCLQTGSVHDPAGKEGLSLATGLMLEEGTRERTGKEIAELVDYLGAETDVAVDKHSTVLVASLLTKDLGTILRLLRETAAEPVFPARELGTIKGQLLTGIQEEEHDTRVVSLRTLARLLYPAGHPYRRPGGGVRRSVGSLGRRDLVRFHGDRYHPRGAILVVVGDVDEEKTARLVARVFGSWKKDGDPGPPDVPDAKGPKRTAAKAVVVPDKTQSDIAFGFIGIRRTDPDFHGVGVMNQILGAFGLGGRLGNRIREEEGLAYYVHSSLHASVGAGPYVIRAGVHPDHVKPAVRIIREEIDRIRRDLVRPSELEETRSYLVGSLPLKLETNDGIASFLLSEEYYGLGPDYLARFREGVGAVSREDVRAAARRLLREDVYSLAVAGPPLAEPLEDDAP
ncbi:MAG: pitrilysin family protein [Candidatus Eisenbacteria bacterium]